MRTTEAQKMLRQMIDGYRVSQIVCLAAELGIADCLANGPQSIHELAARTNSDPSALYRLMRALVSIGVFAMEDKEHFALNPLAEHLQSDIADSLRPWARLSKRFYGTWTHLDHSIATGDTAFDHIHGMSEWQYQVENPEEGQIFNEAMSAHIAAISSSILESYDFSSIGRIVDVAGGQGMLLKAILNSYPAARGVLFDAPAVIRDARKAFEVQGIAMPFDVVGGSFFDAVPENGDAYILSRILHDWNDEQAIRILKNVRHSMRNGARLLIIERVISARSPAVEAALSDLNMMVHHGGRERTQSDFDRLLGSSGLKVIRTIETRSPFCIIEAFLN